MDIIKQLEKSEKFAAIDRHFARFIFKLDNFSDPILAISAALVSRSTREGDVCIDLNKFAGGVHDSIDAAGDDLEFPDIDIWRKTLEASSVVGKPSDYTPLILDNENRLYLQRYWQYENHLIKSIQIRIEDDFKGLDALALNHALDDLFPGSQDLDVDWQKVAAAVAALRRFCVISGGPGTGKTFAIARILAVLIKQAQPNYLRINLAAPTGKSAARLAESVQDAKLSLNLDSEILKAIPETSSTIHRLLKPIKGTPFFRHNAENPLPADVVVVDEASMVDLPLMSKLMQAISIDARIILMGDRHQLASVEAGSILGDICGKKQANGFSLGFASRLAYLTGVSEEVLHAPKLNISDIHDNLIYFTHNYRFGGQSGIRHLSEAVKDGDADVVIDLLKNDLYPEINWYPLESPQHQRIFLGQQINTHYSQLHSIGDPAEGLAVLNRFRILCAVNQGILGVAGLNQMTTMMIQNASRLDATMPLQDWYHGRPILITTNDYELNLFNGDVGIALKVGDQGDKRIQVFFTEGSSTNIRSFTPERLPQHQSVYAMTIHKSQGSEFEDILIVLPELDNPLLTRELLYTGITRAKRNLSILATESAIRSAVSRRIERTSGLRDSLWGSK